MWETELDWQTEWKPANIVLLEELPPEGIEKTSGTKRGQRAGEAPFKRTKPRRRGEGFGPEENDMPEEPLDDEFSEDDLSEQDLLGQGFLKQSFSGRDLPEREPSAQDRLETEFGGRHFPERDFLKQEDQGQDFSKQDHQEHDDLKRERQKQDFPKRANQGGTVPEEPLSENVSQNPEENRQAKKALGRQLYPAMRKAAASFPPPRVNTGEEHVLFVQILLCALILAFSWFARSAEVPFLPQMQTEFESILSTGVEFSTENTFARFADSVVEQLRAGTRRLLEKLEEPEAMEGGQGGVWLTAQKQTVPDGATLEEYMLPIDLQYPVSGYLTSRYGFRDNPVNGEDDFHAGIDIGAAEGTPVFAAQSGIVMRTGYTRLRGYYIILRHAEGVQTLYQHLSYIFVRGGERIEQGQLIADVGSTGFVTGPHLHLELILDGVRVDPLPTFPRYIVA